jgi:hypothetical protein
MNYRCQWGIHAGQPGCGDFGGELQRVLGRSVDVFAIGEGRRQETLMPNAERSDTGASGRSSRAPSGLLGHRINVLVRLSG